MNDYIEARYNLTPCDEIRTDLLAAVLADEGFESFVPDQTGLTAYIAETSYDPVRHSASAVAPMIPLPTEVTAAFVRVEGRDWNAEWERNYFKPIIIGDRCVIHSSFHKDIPVCDYDITIDPKMAFGTGHHSTTSLIISRLLDADLEGRSLIDVGTGTGILAILAAMRGANPVTAVEIDEFAYINAVENVASNGHPEIRVILGDASALNDVAPADFVLANINRNIILSDLHRYAERLLPDGTMMLSGFYIDDVELIEAESSRCGLRTTGVIEHERWACVTLTTQAR